MELKIMTFNLRYDKPDTGLNAWTVRREAVAALISEYAPDIIGTQEGKPHQLLDLHRLLPEYQTTGRDRNGNGTGEYCAIFYKKQQLNCISTGDFSLSQNPENLGDITPEWENRHPRMATWAVFNITNNNKKITVFNTHLDYESAKARELGSELICDRLGKLDLSDSYLLLTGDFNTEPGTLPRENFKRSLPNNLQLLDALSDVELAQQMTYHEFSGKAFAPVDTVYYDSRLSLQAVKVDTSSKNEVWPSDHFPVIADFNSL